MSSAQRVSPGPREGLEAGGWRLESREASEPGAEGLEPKEVRAPGAWSLEPREGEGLQPNESPTPDARRPRPGTALPSTYSVVWWSPSALSLDAEPPFGLRREDLIAKDAGVSVVGEGRTAYDAWALGRATAIASGSAPSLLIRTVTEFAHSGEWPTGITELPLVEVIQLSREGDRPGGRRFGTLVHAVLATTPLQADAAMLRALAKLEGRILGAPEHEIAAAAVLAARVLDHPLLAAARIADEKGNCRREVPVTLTLADGRLLEGVVDSAYEKDGAWQVVDFKTDEDPSRELDAYSRQVGLYASAVARVTRQAPRGVVLVV